MAIQRIRNQPLLSVPTIGNDSGANVTIDAAGESSALIGRLQLPGLTGSKTLSTGKIYWRSGATNTFANVGTTIRVGVQDPSATTGLEDGTFDVSGDMVGGTYTIANSAFQAVTMASGTKTIAHNALIAIVIEAISRAGADSVQVRTVNSGVFGASATLAFPYGTADTGTLAVAQSGTWAVIEFDDGTIGWIQGVALLDYSTAVASIAYNQTSSPDEYAATFTPTVAMQICGFANYLTNVATADTFEAILYSDPYGTPTIVETVALDMDQRAGGAINFIPLTPVILAVGTTYGFAIRPTSNNNISYNYVDLLTGNEKLKLISPIPDCKLAGRTNQTGAFAEVQAYYMPFLAIDVCGLDDGVGVAGGGLRLAGHGGLAS